VLRVLVIDDDPRVRRGIARVLQVEGFEMVEAGNGLEAMAIFEADPPDLVITDINMPEMDGYEVIRALRELKAGVPVIAMSGGGQMPRDIILNSAGLLGAVQTLGKPFLIEELSQAIERALAGGET